MAYPNSGLERLQTINQMLPERCQGCLTGIASVLYLAGLSQVLGEDAALDALDKIESLCEGRTGGAVDITDYVGDDGKPLIPLSVLLENDSCPYAQLSKTEVKSQWRRMNS
jgi:hypothetical protein